MPHNFAITSASNSATLNAQRQGDATFTVSNTSGQAQRGRASVVAQQPASAGWLSVAGEVERDFAPGATQQYSVKINVPPNAPPGTYSFRLDMVGVENPDEDFTEGGPVTFSVPAPVAAPPNRRFPIWIPIVAMIVVLLIAGSIIAAIVANMNRPPARVTSATAIAMPIVDLTATAQVANATATAQANATLSTQSTATAAALGSATATALAAYARFNGQWNIDTPNAEPSLTRLDITNTGDRVNVHGFYRCGFNTCDFGSNSTQVANDGSLNVAINTGSKENGGVRTHQLTITLNTPQGTQLKVIDVFMVPNTAPVTNTYFYHK